MFVEDAELGQIQTPFGALTFLQLVGVSEAELELAKEVGSERVLHALNQRVPHLVVDVHRADFGVQEDFIKEVREAD